MSTSSDFHWSWFAQLLFQVTPESKDRAKCNRLVPFTMYATAGGEKGKTINGL